MSDDLIRRSDAIKAFCIDCKGQGEPCEHSDTCKTMKILRSRKKIPAVEPKRGEWIYQFRDSENEEYRCSKCGFPQGDKPNSCPNCGADMRGNSDDVR